MRYAIRRQGRLIESEYNFLVQISSTKGERNMLFENLTEFNEKWEDYKPAEPLIKDEKHPQIAEKARKTLRAWADANGVKKVTVERDFSTYTFYPVDTDRVSISFWTEPSFSNLSRNKIYKLEELCGSEE